MTFPPDFTFESTSSFISFGMIFRPDILTLLSHVLVEYGLSIRGTCQFQQISLNDAQKREILSHPTLYGPDVLRIIAAEGYNEGYYSRDQ
jgi:hypothetical protein